ncbi:MAG: cytochrome c peroxidase [Pseudomonadota bacterium]
MRTLVFSAALIVAGTGLAAQQVDPALSLITSEPPKVDREVVELGKMLFFDARLSGDGSTACVDCHDPDYGWSDGSELARGYPGTKHWRNSQSIVNVGYVGGGLHWDAGLASLNDQVIDAMGAGFVSNIDTVLAEERLRQIPDYVSRFKAIWGETPNMPRIAEAIATFEMSLISENSPYDQYMAGQRSALSQDALRGLELFNGKANCSSCHNGKLMSDMQFHNVSVPPNPSLAEDPLRQVTFRYLMRNLDVEPEIYDALDRDPGRYLSTKDPQDLGKFRTPPLRYLKYTAPYMHNGVFYTLEEVVEFYNVGGTQDVFQTKSPLLQPLNLSRQEKQALVAFLESMSGSEIKVKQPELPDYEALAFPAASLNLAALEQAPEPAPTSNAEPEVTVPASSGLSMTLRDTGSPYATAETPAVADNPSRIKDIGGTLYVTVEEGDTLGDLARVIYGDPLQYRRLYEANRDNLRNPNDVRKGMLLRIP